MTAPRDIDLTEWLNGVGFHPANTERKQLGHENARQLVGALGQQLWHLLPPGRDKSLTFTALEDALMRANRALALGDGPADRASDEWLREGSTGVLPQDPRVEEYKAEQRARTVGVVPLPEADESEPTWRSTVTGHGNDTWMLDLEARDGMVDLATVCRDPRNVAEVCHEFLAGLPANENGPFNGFHVQIESVEHLNAVLSEIAEAGHRAFGAGAVEAL